MLGTPVRKDIHGTSGFYIPLRESIELNARFMLNSMGIVPDIQYQSKFLELQTKMLSEMVNNTQMFKVPPSVESLQAITPNWGFLIIDSVPKQSEYTEINTTVIKSDTLPCWVALVLVGISITRSTIRPHFDVKFLEADNEMRIDFDWNAPCRATVDMEEVTDIDGVVAGEIHLRDPAVVEREKLMEKERIRDAFRAAEKAKSDAEQMAEAFYAKYDLSDSESAFTGWMTDDESLDE